MRTISRLRLAAQHARRSQRPLHVETLEGRALFATASVAGELFKSLEFSAVGVYSGSTTINQPVGPAYQDNFSGSTNDTGLINYSSQLAGNGLLSFLDDPGSGTENYAPSAADKRNYNFTFSGMALIQDTAGELSLPADEMATVAVYSDSTSDEGQRTPYHFGGTGGLNLSQFPLQASFSWSNPAGTTTGSWSGTFVLDDNTPSNIRLSNAQAGLGGSASVEFAVDGRVLSTADHADAVANIRAYWSSTPGVAGILGEALTEDIPIYWNHASGLLTVDELGEPATGAKYILFVADQDNAVVEPNEADNMLAAGLPNVQLSTRSGSLTDGSFDFGVDTSGAAPGELILRNMSGTTIDVTGLTLSGDNFSLPAHTLPFSLAPGAETSVFVDVVNASITPSTGSFRITMNDPQQPQVDVQLRLNANTAPVLSNQQFNVRSADGTDSVQLTALDDDTPEQTITFSKLSGSSEVQVQPDGTLIWTPPANPPTPRYSFQVSVRAADNGFPSQSVIATMMYVVNGPRAQDDPSVSTPSGQAVDIPVLNNDTATFGQLQPSSVVIVSPPVKGAAQVDLQTGVIRYVPQVGAAGTDVFQYTVQDDAGLTSNLALVTISIGGNHVPTDITLTSAQLLEGVSGYVVGTLGVVDADQLDTHAFAVSDSRFEVADGKLKLKSGVHLRTTDDPLSVRVTATDSGTPPMSLAEDFTITLMANPAPWQNTARPADASRDNQVDINDALDLLVQLRRRTFTNPLPVFPFGSPLPSVDVDGNNTFDINDVLAILIQLRRDRLAGEGEAVGRAVSSSSQPRPADVLFAIFGDSTCKRK